MEPPLAPDPSGRRRAECRHRDRGTTRRPGHPCGRPGRPARRGPHRLPRAVHRRGRGRPDRRDAPRRRRLDRLPRHDRAAQERHRAARRVRLGPRRPGGHRIGHALAGVLRRPRLGRGRDRTPRRTAGRRPRGRGRVPAPRGPPGFLGGAEFVVYPSLGEGFGLPVVEAMATGACVLTTRRLSLPEVGGDAAVYSEPDAPALAAAIAELLDDPALVASHRAAALRRAEDFTWDATAAVHTDAYRAVAGGVR
ncbi:glycosyltransferase [Curtobacterium sp. B18]|uniref:glycosyltransferase n=1 Tax=Curtobacterium sp. B18 TaxID=95614 RepID=UPI0034D98599